MDVVVIAPHVSAVSHPYVGHRAKYRKKAALSAAALGRMPSSYVALRRFVWVLSLPLALRVQLHRAGIRIELNRRRGDAEIG